MAVLTPDYERMQNGQPQDYNTTKQYRKEFADQDIASAQALITNDNNYLVMDAGKLNDLCDTIDYMQQIWADDKEEFAEKYFRLTKIKQYDIDEHYSYGDLIEDNHNVFYVCIAEEARVREIEDTSKWLRIGRDDVGLEFIGWRHSPSQENELFIRVAVLEHGIDSLGWTDGSLDDIGYTYPNIRYLPSNDTPYTREIYMTDWDGGEL